MNTSPENEVARQCALWMNSGLTYDDAFARVMQNDLFKPKLLTSERLGLTRQEIAGYSFVRALRALAFPEFRDKCGLERSVSEAVQAETGRVSEGFAVPLDLALRDLSAGTATDGAELVATDLKGAAFIDVLRNRLAVGRLGATMLPGLVGNAAIPRKTSGSVAGWVATEGGNVSESDPQFDQITLTPKTLGAAVDYTRQLLLQSTPSVEGIVRADLAQAIATAIDAAALEGTGATGQPTGLRNATGVLTSTIAVAGSPTWPELIEFLTDLDASNALAGSLGWIIHPTVRGNLLVTEKATGTAKFLLESTSELAGFPYFSSANGAANSLYFGDWSQILIGMWGALDLIVDRSTGALAGTTRIVALQSVDVGIRHPESFSINA